MNVSSLINRTSCYICAYENNKKTSFIWTVYSKALTPDERLC